MVYFCLATQATLVQFSVWNPPPPPPTVDQRCYAVLIFISVIGCPFGWRAVQGAHGRGLDHFSHRVASRPLAPELRFDTDLGDELQYTLYSNAYRSLHSLLQAGLLSDWHISPLRGCETSCLLPLITRSTRYDLPSGHTAGLGGKRVNW